MSTLLRDDMSLVKPFARPQNGSKADWQASLTRTGRAQAKLWSRTPIKVRLEILAEVDQEDQEAAK